MPVHSETVNDCRTGPFLKWAGGKRWLAPEIERLIAGTRFRTYFEPFCGGAAVFFRLKPKRAVLSDANAELISCYEQVRDNVEAVIAALTEMRNSKEMYYAVRQKRFRSAARRAARVIYLTTLSFNGIYRVNLRGRFNVPYGQKIHLEPANGPKIRAASRALRGAALHNDDFEVVVERAKRDDLIYLDPPYTVAHGNNGFLKYNEKILQWEDQVRLARVARVAAARGCKVIISNADHAAVRDLYRGFASVDVQRMSVMAASSTYRRPVSECIFHKGIG